MGDFLMAPPCAQREWPKVQEIAEVSARFIGAWNIGVHRLVAVGAEKTRRVTVAVGAPYLRKQAATCLRLADQCSDHKTAERLAELAAEYHRKADAEERTNTSRVRRE